MNQATTQDLIYFFQACQNNSNLPHSFMSKIYGKVIHHLYQLDGVTQREIPKLLKTERYESHSILQRPNNAIQKLWIIEKGMTYSYMEHPTRTCVCSFHFPGEIIGYYNSYRLNQLQPTGIRTIGKLKCKSIHIKSLEALQTNPIIANLIDIIRTANFDWQSQILRLQQIPKSEDRYQELCRQHPEYFQLIPLKLLAAHINVAPGTLSRFRSEK